MSFDYEQWTVYRKNQPVTFCLLSLDKGYRLTVKIDHSVFFQAEFENRQEAEDFAKNFHVVEIVNG